MKLHKVLTVGGARVALVTDDVRLDLKSPGRATFSVQSEAPLKGLVTLDIGYNEGTLQRHFLGYVERCTASNGVLQVLYCRELSAVLAQRLPMNLRHVDLRAVLSEISDKTGLGFRVPDKPYARVKVPYFYNLSTGYLALDSISRVFNIPDYIWHQQGNGEVFVGSWSDSFFGQRPPLQLPVELFDGYQGNQSAMIAALPGIRPGATFNNGERITSVALSDEKMGIKWTRQSAAA
ncbi:hypothetical protein [Pseudomonas sp. MRSN 12121]|uniref:hypothetical protein n=1 Tax=Pseudomonas sp. MRSN 12121 TaxID=1611770 RepID=UPI0005BEA029|nr:hypothetical protein [Pseudomonas sp. MRSN 12121]AJO81048.1 prophage PssSM-01 [Pseudomonas sp. MRSN 12121]